MIHVHHGNRLEELAAALVGALGDSADPLAEACVVVPSRAVASYLEREVARARGIAAFVRFPFFEAFLTERLERARPERPVLGRDRLHARLLGLLADRDLLGAEEMRPVREYLRPRSGERDEAELRRFQLADELASLLVDYVLSRPRMVAAWRRGPALAETRFAATEAWQRKLFLAATAGGAETLLGRFEEVPPEELDLPARLHVFGFSYLAPGHHEVLGRLARARELHVYTLDPSAEHWDELAEGDMPALRLWGRPGAVHRRALGELADWDFEDHFADPGRGGALADLQRDLLTCAPVEALSARGGDRSVRILACPGVRRELEVIAAEIWSLLRAEPDLRLDDIAVLIAPARYEVYQGQVSAVFSELHDLPHQVLDLPLASRSRVARALELLLDLPLGRFTRPEVLRLATHPVVAGRFSDVNPGAWVRWAADLGIVHGADRSDHAGTYIERDIFHWDQGIRRLALGGFMAGAPSGARQAVSLGGAELVPEELPAGEERSAARFAVLVRSLIEDARAAREAERPIAQWALVLELLATTYLHPITDEDRRDLDRCRDALGRLRDLDAGRPVSYRAARELARRALAGLRGSRGEGEGGVTVAPLSPMRALPCRVVFAAGLDEGAFPAEERESPLDLRAARRAPTDVSPRERDRYLFLETLLSARSALYLSYVCRDDRTGEEVSPSSAVLELERTLGGDLVEHVPLRRWEEPADSDPIGRRQARCRELRRHLEATFRAEEARAPARDELLEAVRAREPVARLVGLSRPGAGARQDGAPAPALSFAVLRRFLECPLQAWASAVLGLREAELEDPIAREAEPFATARGPEVGILREVFLDHLLAGAEGDEELVRRYLRRAELEELGGQAPTGVFAEAERERHLSLLADWRRLWEASLKRDAPPLETYAFGRARQRSRAGAVAEPVRLTAGERELELSGETDPLAGAELGTVFFVAGPRPRDRHFLRGFVDGAVLAAAGVRQGAPHVATVFGTERAERRTFPAWSREEARAYLGELARELIEGRHDYLLPCEAVAEKARKPDRALETIARALLSGRAPCSSKWGPVQRLDDVAPPGDAEADAIARRRFGRFLACEREEIK